MSDLPKERSIDLSRTLDAPRALVWKVWTDPVHVKRWWGPHGFTNPICEWDARKGGKILIHMKGMGFENPMTGEFLEVEDQARLVFTSTALDKDHTPLLKAHTIVTFADRDGKTVVNVKQTGTAIAAIAPQMLAGMEMGWSQTLDRMVDDVRASA
ncbi:MAG: SRPBCC family protein [Rhizomicrobium sp.]